MALINVLIIALGIGLALKAVVCFKKGIITFTFLSWSGNRVEQWSINDDPFMFRVVVLFHLLLGFTIMLLPQLGVV